MATEKKRWQSEADRLANESIDRGDPTGWFETLYAAGESGEVTMAWDRSAPMPLLERWMDAVPPEQSAQWHSAVVVGCGLGADAEFLAGRGLQTTGFDLSPTAIRTATQRYPDSTVTYAVADLLELPEKWHRGFDLVVDIYTVQALPPSLRTAATAAIRELVAPSGTLLAIQVEPGPDDDGSGPPWLMSREQVAAFGSDGLRQVRLDQVADGGDRYWQAEFRRDGQPGL